MISFVKVSFCCNVVVLIFVFLIFFCSSLVCNFILLYLWVYLDSWVVRFIVFSFFKESLFWCINLSLVWVSESFCFFCVRDCDNEVFFVLKNWFCFMNFVFRFLSCVISFFLVFFRVLSVKINFCILFKYLVFIMVILWLCLLFWLFNCFFRFCFFNICFLSFFLSFLLCVIVLVCFVCLDFKVVVVDLRFCCNLLMLVFFNWVFMVMDIICFFKFDIVFVGLVINGLFELRVFELLKFFLKFF